MDVKLEKGLRSNRRPPLMVGDQLQINLSDGSYFVYRLEDEHLVPLELEKLASISTRLLRPDEPLRGLYGRTEISVDGWWARVVLTDQQILGPRERQFRGWVSILEQYES